MLFSSNHFTSQNKVLHGLSFLPAIAGSEILRMLQMLLLVCHGLLGQQVTTFSVFGLLNNQANTPVW